MAEEVTKREEAEKQTSKRIGNEFGGGVYSTAYIDLRDRSSRPPYNRYANSQAFNEGMEEGVRESVMFHLKKKGISGDALEEKTKDITNAYMNFVQVLSEHGMGVGEKK